MLAEIKKHKPKIYEELMKISDFLGTNTEESIKELAFERMESISIDYAVSENSNNLVIVQADMPWDDIGSWDALERFKESDKNKNIIINNAITINSKNNIVDAKKLVALVNVKNLIIVESEDSILVCDKDSAEQVKEVVRKLKEKEMDEYI